MGRIQGELRPREKYAKTWTNEASPSEHVVMVEETKISEQLGGEEQARDGLDRPSFTTPTPAEELQACLQDQQRLELTMKGLSMRVCTRYGEL
ncbi:unnamed protein product [Ectocarpus sp. 6 AP-2014]